MIAMVVQSLQVCEPPSRKRKAASRQQFKVLPTHERDFDLSCARLSCFLMNTFCRYTRSISQAHVSDSISCWWRVQISCLEHLLNITIWDSLVCNCISSPPLVVSVCERALGWVFIYARPYGLASPPRVVKIFTSRSLLCIYICLFLQLLLINFYKKARNVSRPETGCIACPIESALLHAIIWLTWERYGCYNKAQYCCDFKDPCEKHSL